MMHVHVKTRSRARIPMAMALATLCVGLAGPALTQTRGAPATASAAATDSCPPLLRQRFERLQDEVEQDLCQYRGQVLLVVNTASFCGFTGQYEGLEALYARYRDRGFVVLGFPSNDFGRQEPGSNQAIADFCENTFGVKFPMFGKSTVVGRQANPLYRELAARTGQTPGWNFHKYLVARDGQTVRSFPSQVTPDNPSLIRDIERFLSTKM